jgi:hypothetical protein
MTGAAEMERTGNLAERRPSSMESHSFEKILRGLGVSQRSGDAATGRNSFSKNFQRAAK